MEKIRRIGLPTALASLAVLAIGASSASSAATTVGRSGTSTPWCPLGTGFAALQDPAWGAQPAAYTVPSDGVITSFTAGNSVPPDGNQIKLLILEPVSGTTYRVVAKSDPAIFNVVANGRQTFPTRIAVQAGQMIGDSGKPCIFYTGGSGGPADTDLPRFSVPEPATGAEQDFFLIWLVGGHLLDLSASLEADADHDGFGDETQDCPTTAAMAGPCPPVAATATGQRVAAQKKCKKQKPKKARKKCQKKAKKLPV